MRALCIEDMDAATRALLAVPPESRIALANEIVRRAIAADKYRKRNGHAYSLWGNGTIEGAAHSLPMTPRRRYGDRERLAAEEIMIGAILRFLPAETGTETEAA